MLRFYKVLLVVLLVFLIPTSALSRESFRINLRADIEDENIGAEFEYNLSYRIYIDGGLGITFGAIDKVRALAGFKYYLWEPDEKLYLRIRCMAYIEDNNIKRFRVGVGIGYTTYLNRARSSIELGIVIGSYSGRLDIRPSLGVSVSVSR